MAFYHGIQVQEKQTRVVAPVQVDSAVQVVVGLAPINMGSCGRSAGTTGGIQL